MAQRPGSRRDHRRFCETEGWDEVRNARGGTVAHHLTFELRLADGRVLRTRISRPANADRYGPSLWAHILRDQLDVTAAEFWACVDDGIVPVRIEDDITPPANALPAGLVHQLVHTLGLTADEIAALTLDEAVRLMTDHWSTPPA